MILSRVFQKGCIVKLCSIYETWNSCNLFLLLKEGAVVRSKETVGETHQKVQRKYTYVSLMLPDRQVH